MNAGMETTLGGTIHAGAILDRDYRSNSERDAIMLECSRFCDFSLIHSRKEIENFLLVPEAINRAAEKNIADRAKRSGKHQICTFDANVVLEDFASYKKDYVLAQHLTERRRYERSIGSGADEAAYNEQSVREFNQRWSDSDIRIALIPGKEAFSYVNGELQRLHGISVTPTAVIDAMKREEVPEEMRKVIDKLADFASSHAAETV